MASESSVTLRGERYWRTWQQQPVVPSRIRQKSGRIDEVEACSLQLPLEPQRQASGYTRHMMKGETDPFVSHIPGAILFHLVSSATGPIQIGRHTIVRLVTVMSMGRGEAWKAIREAVESIVQLF